MAQFVDYEPIAPGAWQFQRDDGKPMVLMGPDAEALTQQIDRQREAQRSQMLASNGLDGVGGYGAGGPPNMADVAPRMTASPPPGPAPIGPPPPPPGIARQVAPQGPAQGPAPAPAPPSQNAAVQNYLFRSEVVPGRPGVSQQQLRAKAGQAVALPRAADETVEGGYPVNQDYLDTMRGYSDERRGLADSAAQQAMREAQQGQADAIAEHARASARQQEQDKVTAELTRRVDEDRTRYQQLREEYAGSKINPTRLFSGPTGVVAAIGSAIAQGLGAYAAVLGKTQNFAAQIIDAAISRDIAAQERELQTKGWAADNALSDLLRQTKDLDQAKSVLRATQLDFVAAERAKTAAASKNPEIQRRAQEWDLAEREKQTRFEEEYMRNSLGKHSARISQEMAYPVAPVAGGIRAPSERTIQQRAKTLGDVQGLEKGEADIAKTRADTEKAQRLGGADEVSVRAYKEKAAEASSGAEALAAYGKSLGAEFDPRTRTWKGSPGGVFWSGFGASDRSQTLAAQTATLAPIIGRGLEGNAPNEQTMDDLRSGMLSSSGGKMLAMLNSVQQRLDEKRRAAEAAVPGSVVSQQQQRATEANQQDIMNRTGFAPPPGGGQALPAPRPLR
jgi:hypothetical protein